MLTKRALRAAVIAGRITPTEYDIALTVGVRRQPVDRAVELFGLSEQTVTEVLTEVKARLNG